MYEYDFNDFLKVRAEERMGDAFTAGTTFGVLLLDGIAYKSGSKGLKNIAKVVTAITAIDQIRIVMASLNARKNCIKYADGEKQEEVKEYSKLSNIIRRSKGDLVYQATGKFDVNE